jgi:gamma-glutamyltranspeptidase / glutathione hydrolase
VPLILHDTRRNKTEVICGQGSMPAGATIGHYKGLGLDLIPGTGLLPACIPGTFDAYMLLLRDYGTMRVSDVLSPAIGYYLNGYPLAERASATIATVAEQFRTHWKTSAAVFMPGDEVPRTGSLFRNPAAGNTYARLLKEAEAGREAEIERARKAWSQGFVAEAIDKFCRTQEVMDVSGKPNKGVLTGQDMAQWQATVEAPLTYDYGRYTVCKAGPWTQGPVVLQQLALLKGFNLDGMNPTSPDFIHLQIECLKLAFADREAFYGDPAFVDVPMKTLLSDAYNTDRRKLVDPQQA